VELLATTNGSDRASAHGLMIVGLFLLAGFAAHVLGRRVHVPRVTLLLFLGFLAGPAVFQVIPGAAAEWFPLAAQLALSIIGFQLGERFLGKHLRQTGATVMTVSLAEVLGAALAVSIVLLCLGVPLPLVLLLAAVAPASSPAATLDVIHQTEAKGPVTDTVLDVVAIDDAWAVILFSAMLVVAQAAAGQDASAAVGRGLREVGGGILLGGALGLPMAWLTGRVRPGELTLIETLGFVFLCSGLALRFELSYILACMAMGATVSNIAKHHQRPFHAIEEVEQPFLIIFFVLAGFDFQLGSLSEIGWVGFAYVLARSAGLILGGYVGGAASNASRAVRTHAGWCLLPQAGIPLGLALMVSQRHPQWGAQVLSVIVGTTIIFEILGPMVTRWALHHAGELPQGGPSAFVRE
jgi:Kef-type K+ transport system membrane component KefB